MIERLLTPGSILELAMSRCVLENSYFPLGQSSGPASLGQSFIFHWGKPVAVAQPDAKLGNRTPKRVPCVGVAKQAQNACLIRMNEAKGPRGLRVKLSSAYHTIENLECPSKRRTPSMGAVNITFCSLWF